MSVDLTEYLAEFKKQADAAMPFLDDGWDGRGWKPSELLRIGFYTLLSGENPASSAEFANDILSAARAEWKAEPKEGATS